MEQPPLERSQDLSSNGYKVLDPVVGDSLSKTLKHDTSSKRLFEDDIDLLLKDMQ